MTTESDLIASFLAQGGQVRTLPTRKASGPSTEWLGWTPDEVEQPIPPIGKVRRIIGDQQRAHRAARAARMAEAR